MTDRQTRAGEADGLEWTEHESRQTDRQTYKAEQERQTDRPEQERPTGRQTRAFTLSFLSFEVSKKLVTSQPT